MIIYGGGRPTGATHVDSRWIADAEQIWAMHVDVWDIDGVPLGEQLVVGFWWDNKGWYGVDSELTPACTQRGEHDPHFKFLFADNSVGCRECLPHSYNELRSVVDVIKRCRPKVRHEALRLDILTTALLISAWHTPTRISDLMQDEQWDKHSRQAHAVLEELYAHIEIILQKSNNTYYTGLAEITNHADSRWYIPREKWGYVRSGLRGAWRSIRGYVLSVGHLPYGTYTRSAVLYEQKQASNTRLQKFSTYDGYTVTVWGGPEREPGQHYELEFSVRGHAIFEGNFETVVVIHDARPLARKPVRKPLKLKYEQQGPSIIL